MKVLVIPDVHLKPWMFQQASKLMKEAKADRTPVFKNRPFSLFDRLPLLKNPLLAVK